MLVAIVGGLQSPEMLWGRRGGNGAGHLLSDTERMKMGKKKRERENKEKKKRWDENGQQKGQGGKKVGKK